MRGLMQTNRAQRPKRPDTEEMDLFFRALFRLGIWAGDLETWYGTKPLAGGATEPRAAVTPPRNPSDRPAG